MIQHYLKIAFRNILKYKTQSVISIIGLAVGFACFALANLWIHYEMTYDSYHEGIERTYVAYKKTQFSTSGYSTYTSYMVSAALRKEFPEVDEACAIYQSTTELAAEGEKALKVNCMYADSAFMNMFQITSVLSGSMEFLHDESKIALTEETAMSLFGTTDILGQKVSIEKESKTICAILSNAEQHSNLYFNCWTISPLYLRAKGEWGIHRFMTFVRLHEGADVKAFREKMRDYDPQTTGWRSPLKEFQLIPLGEYHYSTINSSVTLRFSYMILFSIASGMIILCALLNYLSLFTTRMRARSREVELRKVCGSSIGKLFSLFGIEYLLILIMSGLVGMMLIELSLPAFRELTGVKGSIYGEAFLYFAGIILISYLFLIPFIIRRHKARSGNRYFLRRCSIVFQLVICVLFIFCVSILMKQLHFLTHGDIGWERKNTAVLQQVVSQDAYTAISAGIDQMPCVAETLKGHNALFPMSSISSYSIPWSNDKEETITLEFICMESGKELIDFYNIKLLKGEKLTANDTRKAIINESLAKLLNVDNPLGKTINIGKGLTVVGIVEDSHISAPTIPVEPMLFHNETELSSSDEDNQTILIKYQERQWNVLKNRVDSIFAKIPSGNVIYSNLINIEEEYSKFLKSENLLLKLLGFVSIICILVAAFGIFSFITLSCEQRRKEIAIRKVNGATVNEIFVMFLKEYSLLLLTASVIAFPVGYALMKKWLESYVEQTAINVWVYAAIFGGVALLVLFCIGWRVWKAARQNPAEVIKSE